MLNSKSEVAKRFGKARLVDVAKELGMKISSSTHIYRLIADIQSNLDTEGVPLDDELSEDLFDLIVALGYITEDGELIEDDDDEEEEVKEGKQEKLPECWGWGDPENDKACERCPRNKGCVKIRDDVNIPSMTCFGEMHDSDDEQCKKCVLWRLCSADYT